MVPWCRTIIGTQKGTIILTTTHIGFRVFSKIRGTFLAAYNKDGRNYLGVYFGVPLFRETT